jgi:hypothetical protein
MMFTTGSGGCVRVGMRCVTCAANVAHQPVKDVATGAAAIERCYYGELDVCNTVSWKGAAAIDGSCRRVATSCESTRTNMKYWSILF